MTTLKPHAAFVLCTFQSDVEDARRMINECHPHQCDSTICNTNTTDLPFISEEKYEQHIGKGSLHVVLCNVGRLLRVTVDRKVPRFIMPHQHSDWEHKFPINNFHIRCIIFNPQIKEVLTNLCIESRSKGLECWLWMSLLPGGRFTKIRPNGVRQRTTTYTHLDVFGGKIDPSDYINISKHTSSPAEVCAKRETFEESNGIVVIPQCEKLVHITTIKSNTPYPSEIFYTIVDKKWVTPPLHLPTPLHSMMSMSLDASLNTSLQVSLQVSLSASLRGKRTFKRTRKINLPKPIDVITDGLEECHISSEKKK